MATSKSKAKPAAKKAATKAPAKKIAAKPAAKVTSKPAAKPAPKAVAKPAPKAVAKKVSKPVAKSAAKPSAKPVAVAKPVHLHAVQSPKRANAPTPRWIDEAISMAQQNPAVSIVSIIAVAIGVLLILG